MFDTLAAEALAGYDRIIELDLDLVALDGANRNDLVLLEPTIDAIEVTGLLADIGTLSLDRATTTRSCGAGSNESADDQNGGGKSDGGVAVAFDYRNRWSPVPA